MTASLVTLEKIHRAKTAHNFDRFDVYYHGYFNIHNYRRRVSIMTIRVGENNWTLDIIVFGRKRSGNVAIKIVITSNDDPPFADVRLISPI